MRCGQRWIEVLTLQTYLIVAVTAVSVTSLLIAVYLVGKAKWIIRQIDRLNRRSDSQFRHLFRHIQILNALHDQLKFPHPLPPTGGKAGSPDFLKALADHVLIAKPKTVVECGSGISTLVVALQLNGLGHVYSMEHMPKFAEVTRAELRKRGLLECATVLDAPLINLSINSQAYQWYRSDPIPKSIDLLIVDGPPARTGTSPRYPAGPKLFPNLSPKAMVFIDDAGRPEERGVINRWQTEFRDIQFEVNTEDFQKGVCIAHRDTSVVTPPT